MTANEGTRLPSTGRKNKSTLTRELFKFTGLYLPEHSYFLLMFLAYYVASPAQCVFETTACSFLCTKMLKKIVSRDFGKFESLYLTRSDLLLRQKRLNTRVSQHLEDTNTVRRKMLVCWRKSIAYANVSIT